MSNDNLVNLLYYTDKDPLSNPCLTDEQKKKEVFNKLIKIVPKLDPTEDAKSVIAITANNGRSLDANTEFKNVTITITVFVPTSQWLIKGTNLRPFAILGEIQESLNGKLVNGLGRMIGGDFDLNYVTDEMTAYNQYYIITAYD